MTTGFFSGGVHYSLPHPPVPKRTLLIIFKVIDHAWNLLIEEPPDGFDFATANENLITTFLKSIIENRLRKSGEVPGFNLSTFGKVQRDAKVSNYNGKHLDKMPDIFFDLKRDDLSSVLNEYDGIFIECKPVDKDHPTGSCYIKKGLTRFVTGDYAWAMQESMMIAYACPKSPLSKLEKELKLKKHGDLNMDDCSIVGSERLLCSTHQRLFFWSDDKGKACPIKVYHLWKKIPSSHSYK